ncbi:hypothetical protein GGX14DRAFT_339820, partial [Mycena pura]
LQVSLSYPCGFCGRAGENCKVSIDGGKAQSDCPFHYPFSITPASKISQSKPCTNVPIKCPFPNCNAVHWKYNFRLHLEHRHPNWQNFLTPDCTFLSSIVITREEQLALKI